MSNVVRLFDRKNIEPVAPGYERVANALTGILAASAELDHAVRELSKRFDAIDNAIAAIDDAKTASRLKQHTKQSRETLLSAMIRLTEVVGKLSAGGA